MDPMLGLTKSISGSGPGPLGLDINIIVITVVLILTASGFLKGALQPHLNLRRCYCSVPAFWWSAEFSAPPRPALIR